LKITMLNLFGIAAINLTNKLNRAVELYKVRPSKELKNEIVEMTMDRRNIYMYNKEVIDKYI